MQENECFYPDVEIGITTWRKGVYEQFLLNLLLLGALSPPLFHVCGGEKFPRKALELWISAYGYEFGLINFVRALVLFVVFIDPECN